MIRKNHNGGKILIIDDEPDLRLTLKKRLESEHYDVVTAKNGVDGLDKVASEKPDLIVLDVLMPRMSGFDFFKRIREDNKHKHLPIIVLSARSGMRSTFDLFNVEKFMTKPFDTKELLEAIDYLLAEKAILLTGDETVTDRVKPAFEKRKFLTEVVSSEKDLKEKGGNARYRVAVLHLPYLQSNPAELSAALKEAPKGFENVILFSDHNVPGTEDGDTVVIEQQRLKWKNKGFPKFYDARLEGAKFNKVIEKWI